MKGPNGNSISFDRACLRISFLGLELGFRHVYEYGKYWKIFFAYYIILGRSTRLFGFEEFFFSNRVLCSLLCYCAVCWLCVELEEACI